MQYRTLMFCFILCLGCNAPQRNCRAYKTGEFNFKFNLNNQEKTAYFIRTDSNSIDYFEGKTDTSSIKWINDCEFILRKINPQSIAEKQAIHFKIIATTDSSYTFEYKLAVNQAGKPIRVEQGTAYKIK